MNCVDSSWRLSPRPVILEPQAIGSIISWIHFYAGVGIPKEIINLQ